MVVIVIREKSGGDGTCFWPSLKTGSPPGIGSIRRSRSEVSSMYRS
jgi:hypothetical protein